MIKMKYIISAISYILFFSLYFGLLQLSKQITETNGQEEIFIVKFPLILEWSARLSVYFGITLGGIFLYKIIKSDSKITFAHFMIGLFFIVIGIMLELVYAKWSIVVDGEALKCNRVFRKSVCVNVNELDKVVMTGNIIKLTTGENIITYVDKEVDNFDRLYDVLDEHGKIEE